MALRHRLRRLKRGLSCSLALRFPKCAVLLPTGKPLSVRRFDFADTQEQSARKLMIFLPGIGDVLDDFELNGFIARVRERKIAADLLVADTHFGYYVRQTMIERLHIDVIAPAREHYEEIWLVGISLGGLGSLLYAIQHGEDLRGLMLLAPFPGDVRLVNEIANAGGVRNWQPGHVAANDYQRGMWQWLKSHSHDPRNRPDIYLGYGEHDVFARGNRLLAQILPEDHVFTAPGGHDWPTWNTLWHDFLTHRVSP
jgi:pimeloyl-ACP methyl ester carboxylesterase